MSQPNPHCECSISDDSGIIQTCTSCSISQSLTHTQCEMIQDIITSNESQHVYLTDSFINLNASFSNIPSQSSQPPSQSSQPPSQNVIHTSSLQTQNHTPANNEVSNFWQPWASDYVSSKFETYHPTTTTTTGVKRKEKLFNQIIHPQSIHPQYIHKMDMCHHINFHLKVDCW